MSPPRSAAKGKGPTSAGGGPPAPMELDRPPPPGPPARPAGADEDEVVAEYELVLCQPSGADTEVRKTERAERTRGTDLLAAT